MNDKSNPLLWIIGAVVGAFLLIVGALFSAFPSGSQSTVERFQRIAYQVDPSVNFLDPYMLAYFKYQNNFKNITDAQIKALVELFVVKGKILNPNYYKTVVKVIKSPYPPTIERRVLLPDGTMQIIIMPNPLWHPPIYKITKVVNPGQPEYIESDTEKSLLDVMRTQGYTQDDYKMALQLETFVQQEYPDLVLNGPAGKVTVKELEYVDVDPSKLYDFVHERGSIFSLTDIVTIEDAAKTYDVNPVLMVAITGQEESFVPASWPAAEQIRNNPFNVYYSWQKYNTNLADAANIAANTLAHKLSTPPPKGESAIIWINDPKNPWGIYATDTHWAYGVSDIYASLEAYLKK